MPSGARTPTGARSPARTPVASEDEDSDEDSYPASKQPQTTWLHCSVGPKMEEGDEEMDKGNSKVRSLPTYLPYLTSYSQTIPCTLRKAKSPLSAASTASQASVSPPTTSAAFEPSSIGRQRRTTSMVN